MARSRKWDTGRTFAVGSTLHVHHVLGFGIHLPGDRPAPIRSDTREATLGDKAKARDLLAASRTLKTIEAEHRPDGFSIQHVKKDAAGLATSMAAWQDWTIC